MIRAIRGTAVLAARRLADNLPELLQVLRDIPVAWLPRTATEWGRFAETIAHIERLSRTSVLTTNNRLIFRDCARGGYRPTDVDSDESWRVGQEIDELTRAISTAVCHQLESAGTPGNHEHHARLQTDRMLLALGIKRVGRIARRWGPAHRCAQAAYEAQHAVMGGILWPLLSETPVPVGELVAHQLHIRDGFPVSNGHTLIMPKRHVGSFFETTTDERTALFDLLDAAKNALATELQPAAYNIGINDGPAAGQTVPHLHIHLIPRYTNDESSPRCSNRMRRASSSCLYSKRVRASPQNWLPNGSQGLILVRNIQSMTSS